jgi:asparagine synthase (glutamine-hydrolysing)
MCGIAGFCQFKPGSPLKMHHLQDMAETIKHRGPDDSGFYQKGPVGLCMTRLSIVDVQGGSQPQANERQNIWVVFNGEIYNHLELRKPLEKAGHRFATNSDTEVLVHAYEEYGDAFVGKLRGMFAFALWDQTFQKLLIARDHLGVKPLYYTTADGNLIFGSEIKPLLTVPTVKRQVDTKQILTLMTLQYVPSPDTLLKGVRKLPAGHTLVCQSGKILVKPFWELPKRPERVDQEVTPQKINEWTEELRERFFASVKEQLMADVPLGAFLSGGLDSSLVVAAMTQQTQKPVKTYSVGFKNQHDFNELKYSRSVAKYLKSQHQEIMVDARMLNDLIPKLVKYQDDPVIDPAVLPTFVVSMFARQEVKVVLTGEGADEMFGGYRRYSFDRLAGTVGMVPGWLRKMVPFMTKGMKDPYQQAWQALQKSDLVQRHLAWSRLSLESTLEELAGEKLLYEMEHSKVEESLELLFEKAETYGFDNFNLMLYLDLKTWLPDDLLNKVDRMSMAASLEARVPYLDHRLVEFAFGLPSGVKLRQGEGKYILKKAAQKYLPKEIIYRQKKGFAVPLGPWFRNELKPLVVDLLRSEKFRNRGYFNAKQTEKLIEENMSGRKDHHLILYGLLLVELWHRRFIDEAPSGDN